MVDTWDRRPIDDAEMEEFARELLVDLLTSKGKDAEVGRLKLLSCYVEEKGSRGENMQAGPGPREAMGGGELAPRKRVFRRD